jgi:two-component system chemotaxis response regulator CheB
VEEGDLTAYRCRVGHSFSPGTLVAQQAEGLEAALWAAIRALEESAALQRRVSRRLRDRGNERGAARFEDGAMLAEERAQLIRDAVRMDTGFERTAHAGLASIETEGLEGRDTGI